MGSSAESALRYWLDVESLSPPNAEESDEDGEHFFVEYVPRFGRFPWGPMRKLEGRRRLHFIRFGIIPTSDYEAELLALLDTEKAEDDDGGRRPPIPKQHTFLGLFAADHDGRPLPESLMLASFAEAFASLRRPEQSVSDYRARMAARFKRLLEDTANNGVCAPVTHSFISVLTNEAISSLGWTPRGIDRTPLAIVRCEAAETKTRKKSRNPQPAPVDSFQVAPLAAALTAIKSGDPAGLVSTYLAEPTPGARIDCLDLDVIERTLSVDAMPDGCWPSTHDLTLMQQVAVNEALRSCAGGGIFSINGPPGTGKTTLLMDVVASVVVERAKILSSFEKPSKAFEEKWEVQFPNLENAAKVHALHPALHGFGIVVASSNNGAVENITRELPSVAKIDDKYHADAAYFTPSARALLNLKPVDPDDDEDEDEAQEDANGDEGPEKPPAKSEKPIAAWGLISVALGKKKNRNTFINILRAAEGKELKPENIFRQIKEGSWTSDWQRAKQEFITALAEVQRLKQEIAEAEAREAEVVAARAADAEARRQADVAGVDLMEVEAFEKATATAMADSQEKFRRADDGARLLLGSQPNSLSRWLADLPRTLAPMPRTRRWLRELDDARSRRSLAEAELERAVSAVRVAAEATASARSRHQSASDAAIEAKSKREALEIAFGDFARQQPGLLTFRTFRGLDPSDRQQVLPRSSPKLKEARARLFLKAMSLHKAFVIGAGKPFEQNLKRALDMVGGSSPVDGILPDAADHLWATLFLLVPVVSSTFAAFSRCFNWMKPGSIGWLIVDEAGQAVPQHAVGALHKSKRALVVGDPYQVEPVITLDPNVDAKLLDRHGAPPRLQSTSVSMQVIADQINGFGTAMRNYRDDFDWVGSPLKVHRRCADPMFSIANRLAYNSSMVLGRGKAEAESRATFRRPLLGESHWIDVVGIEGNRKHFIPAQAEIVHGIVQAFLAQGWLKEIDGDGLPDLYVISPFKSAAENMRQHLRERSRLWAPGIKDNTVGKWLKKSVGTVHTFQGKEAETVVLLLGGATDGAIQWAAKTPNVLNVAATRAQRRLYVVGDWDRWMRWPLATVLAEPQHLKRVAAGETAHLLERLAVSVPSDPQVSRPVGLTVV